jgi:L-asparaginase II
MTNPILVEVTRGPLVESFHRGAVVVAGVSGSALLSLGDIARPVFPRSAIKPIQALPLIESGAAERFGFGDEEIALACGSHAGGERHVAIARRMMAALNLDEHCLACGPAEPQGYKARQELAAKGGRPTAFHHNCSGKHAGMLAATLATHARIGTYTALDHPVQRHIHSALTELTGTPLQPDVCGIDGCCVPTWAMPLETLARLFAKIGTGEGIPSDRRAAFACILSAAWNQPDLIAGPGRADTVVLAALPRRIFMKTGAEGIYCGALPQLGLGFALKVDDGATRASAAAVMPLIERLIPEARGLVKRSILKTPLGQEAGTIRTSHVYERALDSLKF